jgi:hypothetical protein
LLESVQAAQGQKPMRQQGRWLQILREQEKTTLAIARFGGYALLCLSGIGFTP